MNERTLRLEYVPLAEIQRWPRNPKKHDLVGIRESFERFGFVAPLGRNDETGELLWGHGRLDVLQERRDAQQPPPGGITPRDDGEWLIPVVCGNRFDQDEHGGYLLADNQLTIAGGFNSPMLTQLLAEQDKRVGLMGTGFSETDLDKLLKLKEQEVAGKVVEGMEVSPYEHYDYVVLLFRDSRDWLQAMKVLGVKDVESSVVEGKTKVGLGRVLDGATALRRIGGLEGGADGRDASDSV